jgi:hypothetical protein
VRDLALGARKEDAQRRYAIWFNPWRSYKDEALWASFALAFIWQLSHQIPLGRRLRANLILLFNRFDFDKSKFDLLKMVAFLTVLLYFIVVGFFHPEKILLPKEGLAATAVPTVSLMVLIGWAYERAKKLLGNPLRRDLTKYIRNLHYDTRISFVDQFQEDFARILHSYVGKGKVYVFIDDLDRCEVARAAELMQAINLLLSADQPAPDQTGALKRPDANLFFIMGIDRAVVAAGIASKNKEILPYITAAEARIQTVSLNLNKVGLDFGYRFLEKFINIPFRIPQIDSSKNTGWVARLASSKPATNVEPITTGTSDSGPSGEVGRELFIGNDSREFASVAERIVGALQLSPRRAKQFINLFRLQVLVCIETGVFIPEERTPGFITLEFITLEKIGFVVGVASRWPLLIADLIESEELFSLLTHQELRLTSQETQSISDTQSEEQPKVLGIWADELIEKAFSLVPEFHVSYDNFRQIVDLIPFAANNITWRVAPNGIPMPPLQHETSKNERTLREGLEKCRTRSCPTEISESSSWIKRFLQP